MDQLTEQMVADVLNSVPSTFDAHAAEKRAISKFPREVALEIAAHTNSPGMSALQKFSMQYAQFIDRVFGSVCAHPQIQKTSNGPHGDGKIKSENLAGDSIENQEWTKLVETIAPARSDRRP